MVAYRNNRPIIHEVDWESIEYKPYDPYEVVYSFLTSYAEIDPDLIDRVMDKITV